MFEKAMQSAKILIIDDEAEVTQFIECVLRLEGYQQVRCLNDSRGLLPLLVEYAPELRAIEANWPKIRFHALREHAGLVFQKQLEG